MPPGTYHPLISRYPNFNLFRHPLRLMQLSLTPHLPHSPTSLKRIARSLAQSTGNQDFLAFFNAVEQLHVNFYENTRSAGAVQAGMMDAADYVALAETQLPAPP